MDKSKLIATIPATASPDEAAELLGELPPARERTDQEKAELEAFGVAASQLMRIEVELPEDEGHRPHWHAGDVEDGMMASELIGAGVLTQIDAERLARELKSVLQAAEALAGRVLVEVDSSRPGAEVRLAWADVSGGPAAEACALADVGAGWSALGRLGAGGPALAEALVRLARAAAPGKDAGLSWVVRTLPGAR